MFKVKYQNIIEPARNSVAHSRRQGHFFLFVSLNSTNNSEIVPSSTRTTILYHEQSSCYDDLETGAHPPENGGNIPLFLIHPTYHLASLCSLVPKPSTDPDVSAHLVARQLSLRSILCNPYSALPVLASRHFWTIGSFASRRLRRIEFIIKM